MLLLRRFISLLVVLLTFTVPTIEAQQNSSNHSDTILEMNFEGDLENEISGKSDGISHGDIDFVNTGELPSHFGKQLRIYNDDRNDDSYVSVPEYPELDMTGSWTIDYWFKILSWDKTPDGWRFQPRVVIKPGDPFYYRSNYFSHIRSAPQRLHTGYNVDPDAANRQNSYVAVNTNNGDIKLDRWYHLTFIRDASNNLIAQYLRDKDGNKLFFKGEFYDPSAQAPPRTSDQSLKIGAVPRDDRHYFDGYVDNLTIKEAVANIELPPIISDVTKLKNQVPGDSPKVNAKVIAVNSNIKNVVLHYRRVGKNWRRVKMKNKEGDIYSGRIKSMPIKSEVQYYIAAETNNGKSSRLPALSPQEKSYFWYAVWKDKSMVFNLDFESPKEFKDNSIYKNKIELKGEPQLSQDAVEGNNSLKLDGQDSYLTIDSPFLNATNFTIDFWFKHKNLTYDRVQKLVVKKGLETFNYRIWSTPWGGFVPASYVTGQSGNPFIGPDLKMGEVVDTDQWYRLTFVMEDDIAYAVLRDRQNNLVKRTKVKLDAGKGSPHIPVKNKNPLYIGRGYGFPAYFQGKFDNIRIYNYATTDPPPGPVGPGKKGKTASGQKEVGKEVVTSKPDHFYLNSNYPNPFNPTTKIEYGLPTKTEVEINVFNINGKKISTLVDKIQEAGRYSVNWRAEELPSGVYIYEIRTDEFVKNKKMTLIK